MSLATLARKTKAKQRLRTRGNFILNMTGRGHVLGMNAKMSRGNCKGLTKCAGKRAACCVGVPGNPPPCVELNNQDNTFTVGGPISNFWGYNNGTGGPVQGTLIPNTIDGSGVTWMGWQIGGSFDEEFFINFTDTDSSLPQNHFDSISFVNCSDHSIRTYYTTSADYAATGGTGAGGRPTWRWNEAASGYTVASESAYWAAAVNQTLKMYIDTVPNVEDICCPRAPCCQFKHGGKPAPQMGYGVYLNRKSKGAYHPGGGPQCCTKPNATSGKIVWKQPANIGAGEIVKNKKDTTLACYHQTNNNSSLGSAQCSSKTCSGKGTYIELYKYKMRVGNSGTSYGYDNVDSTTFGNLCPATLMGFRINTMEIEDVGGYRFELSLQTNNINNPTQCSIQSITFVDSLDNSVKTYHTKNVTDFDGDGNIVRWHWSGGNPQDYWAGKLHHCLQVTIEVEKQKTYGLNSCTGCGLCPPCENDPTTNTMVVGQGSGFTAELLTGYNGSGVPPSPFGIKFGSYTPDNIVTDIGTLHMEMAEFSALVPPGTPGTVTSFSDLFVIFSDPSDNSGARFTVAFVDCEDGSSQQFNTADALYKDNTTSGLGGAAANQYTAFIWGNTATYGGTAVDISGIATAQAYAIDGASAYVPWDSMQAWWEAKNGKSLKVIAVPNEGGISQEMINKILSCCTCCPCCPVKKNICGCRATDLLRYTRINKSFGCQTTKTLPFNVSAADQIARKRSSALCPKYGISGFKKPQMLGSCNGR